MTRIAAIAFVVLVLTGITKARADDAYMQRWQEYATAEITAMGVALNCTSAIGPAHYQLRRRVVLMRLTTKMQKADAFMLIKRIETEIVKPELVSAVRETTRGDAGRCFTMLEEFTYRADEAYAPFE
ncbi:MAG TPA: hypothetical protein PK205_07000 [Promineifilum sp.]|nr:hypothetical protein [Promineifilum sp.]